MTSTTVMPLLCTEFHRYSEPTDAFAFHYMEPDTTGSWSTQPFADYSGDYDETSPTYKETGVWLLDPKNATETREALEFGGYKPVSFTDLPDNLRRFVTYNQAPIEWHRGLDDDEEEVTKRVTVWVLGDLP